MGGVSQRPTGIYLQTNADPAGTTSMDLIFNN